MSNGKQKGKLSFEADFIKITGNGTEQKRVYIIPNDKPVHLRNSRIEKMRKNLPK